MRIGAIVVALLVVTGVLLVACNGSSNKHAAKPPSVTVKGKNKRAALQLGAINIETWGVPLSLDSKTKKAILAAAQAYVDDATIAPLESGQLGAGYKGLFEGGVGPDASGPDVNVLTDVATGKASLYDQSATKVSVSGLADGFDTLLYLATSFSINVKATTPAGPITIGRAVELTFAPSGKQWLVAAYRVRTLRRLPSGTTTTTAKSGATP